MLCLVCQLFIISISAIDCLGRFVSEMTYYVSSGTLNLTKPKPEPWQNEQFGDFQTANRHICIAVELLTDA